MPELKQIVMTPEKIDRIVFINDKRIDIWQKQIERLQGMVSRFQSNQVMLQNKKTNIKNG